METLRHLQEFISYVDFKVDNGKDHKDIYSYIDQKILSENSPSKDHVPPLDVIIYAIRNVLYPTLSLQQIPDMLDLLTTVEFYRNHVLSQAKDALVWNSYYRQNGEETITLTPRQEAIIEIQESKNASLRGIYLKLVFQCCQFDIYNLWTTIEPASMTDLMIHMNEYFPLLNKNYTQTSPRLFHFDMSDEENESLRDTGQDCCRFIRDSHAWAVEHKAKDQSLRGICQSTEFTTEFPNPIQEEVLVNLVEYYLNYVERRIREFGEIFKDNQ